MYLTFVLYHQVQVKPNDLALILPKIDIPSALYEVMRVCFFLLHQHISKNDCESIQNTNEIENRILGRPY